MNRVVRVSGTRFYCWSAPCPKSIRPCPGQRRRGPQQRP